MTVPYIDVAHLPSAASFFATALQPLGYRYIKPARDEYSEGQASVDFGIDRVLALRIRQHEPLNGPLRVSNIVLAARSVTDIADFYESGLHANPALRVVKVAKTPDTSSRASAGLFKVSGDACRAMLHDLDGNRLEAVYLDARPTDGNARYSGLSVREAQSTLEEVGRILNWNYGVAFANPNSASQSLMSPRRPKASAGPASVLPTRVYTQNESNPPPSREDCGKAPAQTTTQSGLNTSTVVGALLGVAAGAGVLYGVFGGSRDRSRESPHAGPRGPGLARRSTYPDTPLGINSRVHHLDQKSGIEDLAHREYIYAGGQNGPAGGQDKLDLYANEWTRPRSMANPWHDVTTPRSSRRSSSSRPSALDDGRDNRSRHSTRYNGGRKSDTRARSAGPAGRVYHQLEDAERQKSASSRRGSINGNRNHASPRANRKQPSAEETVERYSISSRRPESTLDYEVRPFPPRSRRSSMTEAPLQGSGVETRRRSGNHNADPDRESYVSARTHKSSSTTRPPLTRPPPAEHEVSLRSGAYSRVSGSRMPRVSPFDPSFEHYSQPSTYVSARNIPLPASEISARHIRLPMSDISARHYPLPKSDIGSSLAGWDDDLDSVVPDDSISCVGSKSSRRSQRG